MAAMIAFGTIGGLAVLVAIKLHARTVAIGPVGAGGEGRIVNIRPAGGGGASPEKHTPAGGEETIGERREER